MKPAPFFVGSLPYESPEVAIEFVKQFSSHLPFLPQLPDANPHEDMVGQMLRGFQLGFWDEKASSCLELFQNEFADAPRCKIQLAGPLTVARSMSNRLEQIVPQWLKFWEGLKTQLKQGAFRGELWLQIDEPFWSKEVPLSPSYEKFLEQIRNSRSQLKIGLHSCATNRPEIPKGVLQLCDFFSFDFLLTPLTETEEDFWTEVLADGRTRLILGMLGKDGTTPATSLILNYPYQVFLSAPCGLYDWTPGDIERVYGKLN